MNFWITILLIVLGATAVIVALAAIGAVMLLYFAKRHRKRLQKTAAEEILKHLPGLNCGACGCKTCADFALSVAMQTNLPEACPRATEEAKQEMDAYFETAKQQFQSYREAVEKADAAAGIVKK